MPDAISYVALIVGVVGSVFAITMSARALFSAWRTRAVEDAENTKAVRENTSALNQLTDLFRDLERRVSDLERKR